MFIFIVTTKSRHYYIMFRLYNKMYYIINNDFYCRNVIHLLLHNYIMQLIMSYIMIFVAVTKPYVYYIIIKLYNIIVMS